MSGDRPLARVARWLADRSGSETRAAEIRAYLHDSTERGLVVSTGDVGSLALLAARTASRRAIRDLPWWLAGLPVASFTLLLLATTFEQHFTAWDLVGEDEVEWTTQAQLWKTGLDVLFGVSVLAALGAGRRAVERLRQGRFVLSLGLLVAMLVASSESDLFIEHTPHFRDGGIRAAQVNEVSGYSIGLFVAFALIPVGYLLLDRLVERRPRPGAARPAPTDEQGVDVDPVALAAAGFPLLFVTVGFFAVAGFWVCLLSARSFSRRLKTAASLAVVVPLVTVFAVSELVAHGNDDGPVGLAFLVWFAIFLPVWVWVAVVALRPLRPLRRGHANSRSASSRWPTVR